MPVVHIFPSAYDDDEKLHIQEFFNVTSGPSWGQHRTTLSRNHELHDPTERRAMGLLSKLFGRKNDDDEGSEVEIALDQDRRRTQLLQLEQVLDEIVSQMREAGSTDNPGWRGKVNEYAHAAGDAMMLRKSRITREAVLDLVFEVRPVFNGAVPPGMERLGELQTELMSIAEQLRQLQPNERPS